MKVAIIMGSDSDWGVMKAAVDTLKSFGVEVELTVASAHRTPQKVHDFVKNSDAKIFIAAAGMAAHLAGVVAGHTTLPVIGIPMKSNALEGMDALLATVMMPPGVPVATVGINGAKNAAVLAVQMLSLADDELAEKLAAEKKAMAEGVIAKDKALQEQIAEL